MDKNWFGIPPTVPSFRDWPCCWFEWWFCGWGNQLLCTAFHGGVRHKQQQQECFRVTLDVGPPRDRCVSYLSTSRRWRGCWICSNVLASPWRLAGHIRIATQVRHSIRCAICNDETYLFRKLNVQSVVGGFWSMTNVQKSAELRIAWHTSLYLCLLLEVPFPRFVLLRLNHLIQPRSNK